MIYIDGVQYNTDCSGFERRITVERKYELTTADGVRHGELAGVYYQYTLTLGNMTTELYDQVLAALLADGDYRIIRVPDGRSSYYTFSALVADISDSLLTDRENGENRFWDDMVVTLTSREPRATLLSGEEAM